MQEREMSLFLQCEEIKGVKFSKFSFKPEQKNINFPT